MDDEALVRRFKEAARDYKPVLITDLRSNAVLVGEEDWNAVREALHLRSVTGMRESTIIEGLAIPADQCFTGHARKARAVSVMRPSSRMRNTDEHPSSAPRC